MFWQARRQWRMSKPALVLDFDDYEDAVVHEAAVAVDADAIVTRNGADFVSSIVPIFTPDELLAAIAAL